MYGDVDEVLVAIEDILESVTDAEDIFKVELLCATAYPPDRAVLVIIGTTNTSETTRTRDLVIDILFVIRVLNSIRTDQLTITLFIALGLMKALVVLALPWS